MKQTSKEALQEHAINHLRTLIKPRQRIYHQTVSRARSGMYRRIRLYTVHEGEILDITGSAADACNIPFNDTGAGFGGCGFSAGDEFIDLLGFALYGDERALGRDRL